MNKPAWGERAGGKYACRDHLHSRRTAFFHATKTTAIVNFRLSSYLYEPYGLYSINCFTFIPSSDYGGEFQIYLPPAHSPQAAFILYYL